MQKPKKRLLLSGSILVIGAIWEFLNHWSLLDAVLSKLKLQGVAGVFIANVITSLSLRLTLIVAGFALLAKAYFSPEADATEKSSISVEGGRDFVTKEITPKYISIFFVVRTHPYRQG